MTPSGPSPIRVGWGFDVHPLGGQPPVLLGGVAVSHVTGVVATSDGDVVAHAAADALLGAANLGDLGSYFPSEDPSWTDANSLDLLARVVALTAEVGVYPSFVDVTVIAQEVRVAPYRDSIRSGLAQAMGISVAFVSVKATTTDHLGFVGRGEAIGAVAVVTAVLEANVRDNV